MSINMSSAATTSYSVLSEQRYFFGNLIHGRPHHGDHQRSSSSLLISSSNQRLFLHHRFSTINLRQQPKRSTNMVAQAIEHLQPGGPLIPTCSPAEPQAWSNWLLLSIVPMLLSFFKNKWGPLLSIKNKVDVAMDTVEAAAEMVEGVARKVDHVLDEVEEKIPEGKFKDALCAIDQAAENIIMGADIAEDLIHKVEELEEKLENIMDHPAGDQDKMLHP